MRTRHVTDIGHVLFVQTLLPMQYTEIFFSCPLSFLGVLGVILFFFPSHFSIKIPLNKQNSHRWDAAFCGVTSRAILFAYVPQKGRQG